MSKLQLQNSTAYIRDGFVPFEKAQLSIASSPVLYGLSIYTVFGVHWNTKKKKLYAFRLKDHYDRLINSAKIMDFRQFMDTWPYERFEQTMLDLLRKNNIQEDALVRVSVFIDEILAGTKIGGLKNSLNAFVYPLGEILPLKGMNVCVSSWQRTPDNSIPSRAKINGSYVNASLIKHEALQNGYDDAIALDEHAHVSEGTVANLFLVRNGKLITPDNSTDMLEGLTRGSLLQIAHDLGIPFEQRSVDRSELYVCDEAFVCGSSARIVPVLSIDKRPIGQGKTGSTTKQLRKAYEEAQWGLTSKYAYWRLAV